MPITSFLHRRRSQNAPIYRVKPRFLSHEMEKRRYGHWTTWNVRQSYKRDARYHATDKYCIHTQTFYLNLILDKFLKFIMAQLLKMKSLFWSYSNHITFLHHSHLFYNRNFKTFYINLLNLLIKLKNLFWANCLSRALI